MSSDYCCSSPPFWWWLVVLILYGSAMTMVFLGTPPPWTHAHSVPVFSERCKVGGISTFQEAINMCREINYYVATPMTSNENTYMFLTKTSGSALMGGIQEVASVGNWRWGDGPYKDEYFYTLEGPLDSALAFFGTTPHPSSLSALNMYAGSSGSWTSTSTISVGCVMCQKMTCSEMCSTVGTASQTGTTWLDCVCTCFDGYAGNRCQFQTSVTCGGSVAYVTTASASCAAKGGFLAAPTEVGTMAEIRRQGGQQLILTAGYDELDNGVWTWLDGPEAHRQFWSGGSNGSEVYGDSLFRTGYPTNGDGKLHACAKDTGLVDCNPNSQLVKCYACQYMLCAGGACLDGTYVLASANPFPTCSCSCEVGYGGPYCRCPTAGCSSVGGKLVQQALSCGCECKAGYMGPKCDKSIAPIHTQTASLLMTVSEAVTVTNDVSGTALEWTSTKPVSTSDSVALTDSKPSTMSMVESTSFSLHPSTSNTYSHPTVTLNSLTPSISSTRTAAMTISNTIALTPTTSQTPSADSRTISTSESVTPTTTFPTPTDSAPTLSHTVSKSFTMSCSTSASKTLSTSESTTATIALTPTASQTPSADSRTISTSESVTSTDSAPTLSHTASNTFAMSHSTSGTETQSISESATASPTTTITESKSETSSVSTTASRTGTSTASRSGSRSLSMSATHSLSTTTTSTNTITDTQSCTPSGGTPSETSTHTDMITETESLERTSTPTNPNCFNSTWPPVGQACLATVNSLGCDVVGSRIQFDDWSTGIPDTTYVQLLYPLTMRPSAFIPDDEQVYDDRRQLSFRQLLPSFIHVFHGTEANVTARLFAEHEPKPGFGAQVRVDVYRRLAGNEATTAVVVEVGILLEQGLNRPSLYCQLPRRNTNETIETMPPLAAGLHLRLHQVLFDSPPPLTSAGTRIAVAAASAVASLAGPMAADLQVLAALSSTACSPGGGKATGQNEDATEQNIRSLSVVALDGTCEGVLLGNALVLGGVFALHGVAVCVCMLLYRCKGAPYYSLLEAAAKLRFPSVEYTLLSALHVGCVVCGAQLVFIDHAHFILGVGGIIAAVIVLPVSPGVLAWLVLSRRRFGIRFEPFTLTCPSQQKAVGTIPPTLHIEAIDGDTASEDDGDGGPLDENNTESSSNTSPPSPTAPTTTLHRLTTSVFLPSSQMDSEFHPISTAFTSLVSRNRLQGAVWASVPYVPPLFLIPVVLAPPGGCVVPMAVVAVLYLLQATATIVFRPASILFHNIVGCAALAANGALVGAAAALTANPRAEVPRTIAASVGNIQLTIGLVRLVHSGVVSGLLPLLMRTNILRRPVVLSGNEEDNHHEEEMHILNDSDLNLSDGDASSSGDVEGVDARPVWEVRAPFAPVWPPCDYKTTSGILDPLLEILDDVGPVALASATRQHEQNMRDVVRRDGVKEELSLSTSPSLESLNILTPSTESDTIEVAAGLPDRRPPQRRMPPVLTAGMSQLDRTQALLYPFLENEEQQQQTISNSDDSEEESRQQASATQKGSTPPPIPARNEATRNIAAQRSLYKSTRWSSTNQKKQLK